MGARVDVTPAAAEMMRSLRGQHGDLIFHQSGGCCDGSAPMCFPRGDFRVGPQDVLLGEIAGCAFLSAPLSSSTGSTRSSSSTSCPGAVLASPSRLRKVSGF